MVYTAQPIVILKVEDGTYGTDLDCFNNLSDEDTEILIEGPADLGQVHHPAHAQVPHPIHSEVRRDLSWTPQEDRLLLKYIQRRGEAWSGAARSINRKLHRSQEMRSSNCCRQRWRNYLRAILHAGRYLEKSWTYEEDSLLLDLHDIFGDSWRYIASMMPGRTRYTIKKRYRKLMIYRSQFGSDGATEASDYSSNTEGDLHLTTYIE